MRWYELTSLSKYPGRSWYETPKTHVRESVSASETQAFSFPDEYLGRAEMGSLGHTCTSISCRRV